jgi:hypothetical protein
MLTVVDLVPTAAFHVRFTSLHAIVALGKMKLLGAGKAAFRDVLSLEMT